MLLPTEAAKSTVWSHNHPTECYRKDKHPKSNENKVRSITQEMEGWNNRNLDYLLKKKQNVEPYRLLAL